MANCSRHTTASIMPVKAGGIRLAICMLLGSVATWLMSQSSTDTPNAKAQAVDRQNSAISGHRRRWRQTQIERRFFRNTSAPPWAQRSRCFHRPRRVSGIRIQHRPRGS
ncbi:hypothetical protein D3C72_2126740 [compost metagenome]